MQTFRPFCRTILAFVVAVAALGCTVPESSEPERDRLVVAAVVPPLAWLAERVGGERVDAFSIVEPGASPATFQPTDAQMGRLAGASLVLLTGVPLERAPWFRSLERIGAERLDLRAGIGLRRMAGDHHGEAHGALGTAGADSVAGTDPHIWLSPRLLAVQAATLAAALCELDAAGCAEYARRRDELQADLARLDAELTEQLAPLRDRAFLVFHPAWGYLADAYRLRQVAVEIEGKSPSDAELHALTERIAEERVSTLFVQPQISSRVASALAERVGLRVETLDPLAPDVVANLRRVAEQLVASIRVEEAG